MATGAAHIFVDAATGSNAIIVAAGAAGTLGPADADAIETDIAGAQVFVTQLEQPVAAARRGLELARRHGVTTVLNPAPALPLPDDIFPLCDYVTPNETEAAALTGIEIISADDARRAADALLAKGAGAVIVTLGEAERCCIRARSPRSCRRFAAAPWSKRPAPATVSRAGSPRRSHAADAARRRAFRLRGGGYFGHTCGYGTIDAEVGRSRRADLDGFGRIVQIGVSGRAAKWVNG